MKKDISKLEKNDIGFEAAFVALNDLCPLKSNVWVFFISYWIKALLASDPQLSPISILASFSSSFWFLQAATSHIWFTIRALIIRVVSGKNWLYWARKPR